MASDPPASPSHPMVDAAAAAFDRVHEGIAQRSSAARDETITKWAEAFEGEHAATITTALRDMLDHAELPAVVRAVLEPLSAPEHQTQVFLGLMGVFTIVGSIVNAVIQPYARDAETAAWTHEPTQPVSPADAALAELKGVIPRVEAMRWARANGVGPDAYPVLFGIAGEPPGLMQLLEAFRRGYIDRGRLEHGIKQSRVRDEWSDVVVALRYAPPSVGEVLAGAVQSHLAPDDARHRLSEAGIDPENYEWLYETAGRPPGTVEMLHLWNRGELTEAEVVQGIKESDVKNKYIPALLAMRRYMPPPRTIVSMLRHGAITDAEATHRLMAVGVTADDAAMYVREAKATRTQAVRELTETQVRELYAERLINRGEAHRMLTQLRYDAHEADWILDLADHQHHYRFQQAAINRVHALYVSHHIDRRIAGTTLDAEQVPAEARDDLLALWDIERATNAPTLSLSQLQRAYRDHLITKAQFNARAKALGWRDADLLILRREAWPPASGGVPEDV